MAAAAACAVLGVNAFDQPDVQDSKDRTNAMIADFYKNREFEDERPVWSGEQISVYAKDAPQSQDLPAILDRFLAGGSPGDYIALNAFLPRSEACTGQLDALRQALQRKTGLPVTLGFGPRFLHSTGQLHKGGKNNGLFIQITADPVTDLDMPGEAGMTFGTLQRAQALGDLKALQSRGRRVVRVHLAHPDAVERLVAAVQSLD
jgi:hypothetical protein